MKILIAEDSSDTATVYKLSLENRGHKATVATDGEECLKIYHDELQIVKLHSDAMDRIQPFDAVVLDYKIPQMNGLEVAKEILAVNSHQRLILASDYLRGTLLEAVEKLNRKVEILYKPFSMQVLIDTIEDKSIYSELKNMDIDTELVKKANLRHEQLRDALDLLRKAYKEK